MVIGKASVESRPNNAMNQAFCNTTVVVMHNARPQARRPKIADAAAALVRASGFPAEVPGLAIHPYQRRR
jgi:hypothetical protein